MKKLAVRLFSVLFFLVFAACSQTNNFSGHIQAGEYLEAINDYSSYIQGNINREFEAKNYLEEYLSNSLSQFSSDGISETDMRAVLECIQKVDDEFGIVTSALVDTRESFNEILNLREIDTVPSQNPTPALTATPVPTPTPEPTPSPTPHPFDVYDELENASLQYPSQNDIWAYNKFDSFVEITGYLGPDNDTVVIPGEIESLPVRMIGENALADAHISNIELPDSILEIKSRAFYDNDILESIRLSSNLMYIDAEVFHSCDLLKEIEIPSLVIAIGYDAF